MLVRRRCLQLHDDPGVISWLCVLTPVTLAANSCVMPCAWLLCRLHAAVSQERCFKQIVMRCTWRMLIYVAVAR